MFIISETKTQSLSNNNPEPTRNHDGMCIFWFHLNYNGILKENICFIVNGVLTVGIQN